MRHVTTRRNTMRSATLAVLVLALGLLALSASAALAASSPAPVADQSAAAASPAAPVASPAPSPASPAPEAVTCALSQPAVDFGSAITVTGIVTPAVAGQQVAIALDGTDVGTALTDAAGAYTMQFTPRRGGSVVARLVADGTASAPQALAVKVKAAVSHGSAVPFLKTRFVVKVAPSSYSGLVAVKVIHRGVVAGTYAARVHDGRAVLQIPLRGVDGFTLAFALPAGDGFAASSLQTKVQVKAHTLTVGSTGPYVTGMLTGLQRLYIHVPGMGSRFTTETRDSVMAFQKAYRLSRSYVFDTADWRKMDGAKPIKPRYPGPSIHLEVDKGRQILMVVKNGAVAGLICVSTGATNNTPEGTFQIQQKHPYTTSGFGGILVRTMGFVADFAIHGYAPVPPYPASHGCVREPIWACYWTYDQSFVGERLYVYH